MIIITPQNKKKTLAKKPDQRTFSGQQVIRSTKDIKKNIVATEM